MKRLGLMAALGALLLAGCATVTQPQVTSVPFDPNTMEYLGQCSGSSTMLHVLGIGSAEGHSVQYAINQALVQADADLIINPSVEVQETSYFLGLAQQEVIRVSGIAVRIRAKSKSRLEDLTVPAGAPAPK